MSVIHLVASPYFLSNDHPAFIASPAGPSVAVHPGLQGSVQADIRPSLARTMADSGCEGAL